MTTNQPLLDQKIQVRVTAKMYERLEAVRKQRYLNNTSTLVRVIIGEWLKDNDTA